MEPVTIIPKPNVIKRYDGTINARWLEKIDNYTENSDLGDYARKILTETALMEIDKKMDQKRSVTLRIDKNLKQIDEEGYKLTINDDGVLIRATNDAGIFYGLQSLKQLLKHGEGIVPHMEIIDSPRFKWRGFMLDECRHFHGIDVVKEMLDAMAMIKLNVFHWHLTEDQGWRIEIKKYPKLTEIGSKRSFTQIGGWISRKNDGTPHEGYYTQEEIREVVQYARDRYITVVPEIEMPGHCSAAIAAYPELGCTGAKINVPTNFGIKKDIYCAGREHTFEFLTDVLDEVIELFPSEVIHIGGDEVPKSRWKHCDDCQRRIHDEGLEDEDALQVYFTNRISKYLESKGRRAMGWNEILDDGLAEGAIGQWWARDKKKVLAHLRNGRDFVMSRIWYAYIDYRYELIPLWKSYKFDPVPKDLEEKYHEHVLGFEAPMWTEWVPDTGRLYWQTFPRLIALAEVGWTEPGEKDYKDFKGRLHPVLEDLEDIGVKSATVEESEPGLLKRILNKWKIVNREGRV